MEQAGPAIDDPEPYVRGSFDEVVLAYDLGSFPTPIRRARRGSRERLAVGQAIVGVAIICTVGAPLLTAYNPIKLDVLHPLAPPLTHGHLLGADQCGRDILARILYGGRIDFAIAVGATSVTLVFGTIVGLVVGYFGGWVDNLLMRIVDLFVAVPFLC